MTVIVRSNVATVSDVLIRDMGILVSFGGGQINLTREDIDRAARSISLRVLATDDAFGVGSSTLIVNDGTSDIPQADVDAFLTVTDHEFLSGLGDDDHTQYALLSGGAARNTFTGSFDASGGTIILPQEIAPAPTAEGDIRWDTDDDRVIIGTGGSQVSLARVGDAPTAHAASHQHGGTDEIAVLSPAANAIPKAGAGSTLDPGWLPASTESAQGAAEIATQVETNTGTDDTRIVTPLKQANYVFSENNVIAGRVFN